MTTMINSKECPKCGSNDILCKDEKFSCLNCELSFCCFGDMK